MEFWRMPLDAAEHKKITGKVNVLAYRCKGCRYCIEFCPNNVLEESKDFNEKGYHPPVVKTEGKCVNCNFCETVCPEFAIFVTAQAGKDIEAADVIRNGGKKNRRGRKSGG